MAKIIQKDNKELYQCGECGFHYEDRALAEKCEAWCREHKSCNLDITAHAEENKYMMGLNGKTEIAVFGGGCFWCTEAVFKMLKGIVSVMPGYAGGPSTGSSPEGRGSSRAGQAPTYEEVSGGTTGHAEVIKIEFNPEKVRYRDLLTVFFSTHDPTTPNRQGADVGTQYRSVIFYTDGGQKKEAEEFIVELNASNSQGAPIVTAVERLTNFYEAESYHQNYYAKNQQNAYCQVVINPKLEKVQQKFAKLLNNEAHHK